MRINRGRSQTAVSEQLFHGYGGDAVQYKIDNTERNAYVHKMRKDLLNKQRQTRKPARQKRTCADKDFDVRGKKNGCKNN